MRNATLFERIDAMTIPEPMSGCWLWIGATGKRGHGRVKYRGQLVLPYRVNYERFIGPIPPGKMLRHKCDVPFCVNPHHVIPGESVDNVRDMIERSEAWRRSMDTGNRRGESHSLAKLTGDSVRQIRTRHTSGESVSAIARSFGVGRMTISAVVSRKTWKHII